MDCNEIAAVDAAVVAEFAYLTVCMEGKHIFDCLDGYAQRKGSGINDDMGCYFANELAIGDSDRRDDRVLIYHEDKHGVVRKIHLSEEQFYHEFVKAFDRAAFLFNEEEWLMVQGKLAKLKTVFCTG